MRGLVLGPDSLVVLQAEYCLKMLFWSQWHHCSDFTGCWDFKHQSSPKQLPPEGANMHGCLQPGQFMHGYQMTSLPADREVDLLNHFKFYSQTQSSGHGPTSELMSNSLSQQDRCFRHQPLWCSHEWITVEAAQSYGAACTKNVMQLE